MPIALICDDACTFVCHTFQRYPAEAEIAFGETRGCYQLHSDDVPPDTGLSCKDIIPIELQSVSNRHAMENSNFLSHPDSESSKRYVFGTR